MIQLDALENQGPEEVGTSYQVDHHYLQTEQLELSLKSPVSVINNVSALRVEMNKSSAKASKQSGHLQKDSGANRQNFGSLQMGVARLKFNPDQ